ncbi:MAG: sigma-70 family RNA polymerase sigma factor [Oscillospiraceae bacterium]|nr:sigma-70 family RNA polymerase sigma factor [Oscillospiraceae bacterium]
MGSQHPRRAALSIFVFHEWGGFNLMSLFSLIAGGVSIHNWFPVPILMLVMMSDSDREFLQELYYQHRNIMYHVARKHFADKPVELEEAISITLERMCRYVKKLREVPSNKIQAYVVLMVENVCRNQLRQIIKEREQRAARFNDSNLCNINSVSVDPYETLFNYADAKTLLASFQGAARIKTVQSKVRNSVGYALYCIRQGGSHHVKTNQATQPTVQTGCYQVCSGASRSHPG